MSLRYPILTLMLSGLLGCASTSDDDYATLAQTKHSQTIDALVMRVAPSTATESEQTLYRLTDLVDIPELDHYLEQALNNNPSLQQSLVALKLAYAQEGVSIADQLPSVTANFSGQNSEQENESYSADLTVSWELDLWQKLASSTEATRKDIAATQAGFQSATDLLAANIMRGWLEISVNQQLLAIERRRLNILENNETLILERYQVGLGTLEELDNAKTSASQTRSTVAQYQESLEQSQRSLMLLVGEINTASNEQPIPMTFPKVLNPLDDMPVQNLSGRPDLQQAFFNIEADALRTDVAYKAMLPSFSLSASLKDMAQTPSEALLTNPMWSLLGQISAPLFQGGKLKAQADIAELTTEQTFWAYQETLLNAVNEVENAIGQESSLATQQHHLQQAHQSAIRSIDSYQEKYRQGLVDIFDLLTVQQQAYDVEAQLTNATYQRLMNRIDLGLALGLGVENSGAKA